MAAGAPRRVYLDLGANWGDTLTSYRTLASTHEHRTALNWEVYSFEASPFIIPHVDALVRWRNGLSSERPLTCVPPVGSTNDMLHFASSVVDTKQQSSSSRSTNQTVSCFRRYAHSAVSCMTRIFQRAYFDIVDHAPNTTLLSASSVASRLAEAAVPHAADAKRPRFTLIPAAVGTSRPPRTLDPSRIRTFGFDYFVKARRADPKYKLPSVRVADLPKWLGTHFSPRDYIVAKVDIESAEHELFHALRQHDLLRLLDGVAYECHTYSERHNCSALQGMLRESGVPIINLCRLQARVPHESTSTNGSETAVQCRRGEDAEAFWRGRRAQWQRGMRDKCAERFGVTLINVSQSAS